MRRNNPFWQRGITVLLWAMVGVAKTMALLILLTAADTRWADAAAWLLLAFGMVAVALLWRLRLSPGGAK